MSDRLPFVKMQGVGNDFVVVDGRERLAAWAEVAVAVCRRRLGVGADGLLVIQSSDTADLRMAMFNPDGSPDVCGNGLRCIARYAVERGLVAGSELTIETLAGVRSAALRRAGSGDVAVTVDMGEPQLAPPQIPMCVDGDRVIDYPLALRGETLPISALSTGSTHAVTFGEALPADEQFFTVSPQVEHHPLFPERTSLMWCQPLSPTRIAMRIWERGAGETLGCGTGACAAAVAAVLNGLARPGEAITIASRGGELTVQWREGHRIQMTGPAETVFSGWWPVASTIGSDLLDESDTSDSPDRRSD